MGLRGRIVVLMLLAVLPISVLGQDEVGRAAWLIQFIAVLALVLIALALERWALRPVRALLRGTESLAAGDLSARTGLAYTGGEIGRLARAFDEMATARQRSEERIARFNQSLQRRVENRTQALTVAMETAQREHAADAFASLRLTTLD